MNQAIVITAKGTFIAIGNNQEDLLKRIENGIGIKPEELKLVTLSSFPTFKALVIPMEEISPEFLQQHAQKIT